MAVGSTGTYTIAIVQGRGTTVGCPDYLGAPACGAGTAPLLQTFTQGTTGLQQWTFNQVPLGVFFIVGNQLELGIGGPCQLTLSACHHLRGYCTGGGCAYL